MAAFLSTMNIRLTKVVRTTPGHPGTLSRMCDTCQYVVPAMKIIEFTHSIESLREAKQWLLSLGVTEAQMPRINSLIDFLGECVEKQGMPLPQGMRDEYYSTVVDAWSFAEIHRHFSKIDVASDSAALGKLRLACRSPLLGRERANNKPRDHLFELQTACWFGDRHCSVSNYDDVQVVVDGRPVNIECKRISSANKVRKNVNKAESQLISSFPDLSSRGCIALSLEKIIDFRGNIGGRNHLLSEVPILNRDFDSRGFGMSLSQKVCARYREAWRHLDDRIIAILLFFRCIVRVHETDQIFETLVTVPLTGGRCGRRLDQLLIERLVAIDEI